MKKLSFILSFVMVLGFTTFGNANLIDNGGGLIYDTDLNITWFAPESTSGTWDLWMNWPVALNSINFKGTSGWRLPSALNRDGSGPCQGYNCTESEMGHLFYVELGNIGFISPDGTFPQPGWGLKNLGPFSNLRSDGYWTSMVNADNPHQAWFFDFTYGMQMGNGDGYARAMVVTAGNIGAPPPLPPPPPPPVPEPATMLLLGTGIAGLVGTRLRRKKK